MFFDFYILCNFETIYNDDLTYIHMFHTANNAKFLEICSYHKFYIILHCIDKLNLFNNFYKK